MYLEEVRFTEETRSAALKDEKLTLLVRSVTYEAENILSFELVARDRGSLPSFTAGAHVDVDLPNGAIRQYSLSNSPSERNRYLIAVLREEDGRGGSLYMHQNVTPGTELTVSYPRNHFHLDREATYHLLIAGGIGITPIMSMLEQLEEWQAKFHLIYCTRSRERTAFSERIETFERRGLATLYHDNGDPAKGADLDAILSTWAPGTHVYYCGPPGLMAAIERASQHLPLENVHRERFVAPDSATQPLYDQSQEQSFKIKLARTGRTFTVEQGQSIVEVLRDNGVDVDTSCEEGYCGTCMTRYLSGSPIHRDTVLDEEDRAQYVMICCARSSGGCLELDL